MVVVFPKSNRLIQLRSGEARPVEKIPKAETLGAIQDEVDKLKNLFGLNGWRSKTLETMANASE